MFEDAVEAPVSGLVPLLVQEWLCEGDERAGVTFSVGQVRAAVGVAVEDEEVLTVDDPAETEFAEPVAVMPMVRSSIVDAGSTRAPGARRISSDMTFGQGFKNAPCVH